MGIYLSTPKTEKASEDGENDKLRFGLSSMQGWRASMEDAHAAHPYLDESTSFFGVFDGHGGKAVSKFCAKYLHQQVLKHEAYIAGDLGTSLQKSFLRMDEMMLGQRGWRELAVLGDKMEKLSGMLEGFIWSPKGGEANDRVDDWAFEEGPHSDFSGPNCGSTACVAIIQGNKLVVANAGDSRCVLSRKGQWFRSIHVDCGRHLQGKALFVLPSEIANLHPNYSLHPSRAASISVTTHNTCTINCMAQLLVRNPCMAHNLSKDHKPDLEAEKDRILKAGGFIQVGRVNGSINLTRAIGDMEFKQNKFLPVEKQIVTADPDITSVELCDDDEFLEDKLSAVCEKVFERCLAPTAGGEGCDNMTMILIQFKNPSNPSAPVTNQPQSSAESSEADNKIAEKTEQN
ncbi:hypothetical protein Lal_00017770 [Lupinus albus]|nr:hypothetical protein Lal_00017770 [Lupinus albus]